MQQISGQNDGFTVDIPQAEGEAPVHVELVADQALYILGPNGTGKSSLLYYIARHNESAILVAGNREIVFESSAISISAADAARREENAANNILHNEAARVVKTAHNDINRLNWLLFRLKSLSDDVNKRYVRCHQNNQHDRLQDIIAEEPTKLVNQALAFASIPVCLDWNDKSELRVKKGGDEYGIQEMSDGERAALILVGEILLAKKQNLILIDEPERHLHRSISSPLLRFIRSARPDLSWVIATHDLSLPRDDENSYMAILYEYFNSDIWSAEVIQHPDRLPEFVVDAVYGARQKVIFVEGNRNTSLDLPLYRIIFPDYTIVAAGTCRQVRESTVALMNSESIHHMEARGIVDGDNRDDVGKLHSDGVSVLKVYAVESVYYHPQVIEFMLARSAENRSLEEISEAAIEALRESQHLARKSAYKKYRNMFFNEIPDENTFADHDQLHLPIDGRSLLTESQQTFHDLIERKDWKKLVEGYKIKSSRATNVVARELGFGNASNYERAVQKYLGECEQLRQTVSQLVPDPFAADHG